MPAPQHEKFKWWRDTGGKWKLYRKDLNAWTGYTVARLTTGYAVLRFGRRVDEFTDRQDARGYAELRAELESNIDIHANNVYNLANNQ